MKFKKGLELVSRVYFSENFFIKTFLLLYCIDCPLSDCVYFPSYSLKCVLWLMLGHLMTSWRLDIWKVKTWLYQERKELRKWNKETFFLISQVLAFRLTKQTRQKGSGRPPLCLQQQNEFNWLVLNYGATPIKIIHLWGIAWEDASIVGGNIDNILVGTSRFPS